MLRTFGAGAVEPILRELSPRFEPLFRRIGRPSVPPEFLWCAMLSQMLRTIRSERQLVELFEINLLFRWFVGLDLEAPAWHATTVTKPRQRLLDGDIARVPLGAVVARADVQALLSRDHCTVDGTLLEAFASHTSVRPKDTDDDSPIDPGNDAVSRHGEPRFNATHRAVTVPDARLVRTSHNTARSSAIRRRCRSRIATAGSSIRWWATPPAPRKSIMRASSWRASHRARSRGPSVPARAFWYAHLRRHGP